jgi:hypothetical protein
MSRQKFSLAALSILALTALVLSAPRASAWGVYDDCSGCHSGFVGGFGATLHDLHLDSLVDGPCTVCHTTDGGTTPVPTGTDDPDEFTGCVGCHGRDEDMGFDSVSPGRGEGLRQHHYVAGPTSCAGCHTDANPANDTPVDEDILPKFYVAGLAVNNDSCTDNLDNDGDNLYDGADSACAAATPTPTPTPTATPTTPPASTLDHFLCYKARRAKGEERFERREVELSNQFQTRKVEISKAEQFCNPVAVTKIVDDQVVIFPIIDPASRLTCYKVRRPVSVVKPQVISTDHFGEQELNVKRRRTELCVPSQEVGEPSNLAGKLAPSLDHFELYKARRKSGTPKFERQEVGVVDPLMGLNEIVELKKPVKLGVPTDKNDEGIFDPSAHLTCYSLRAPRFEKQDVEMVNQFGESGATFRLTLKKPNMLCVPSDKQVISGD